MVRSVKTLEDESTTMNNFWFILRVFRAVAIFKQRYFDYESLELKNMYI